MVKIYGNMLSDYMFKGCCFFFPICIGICLLFDMGLWLLTGVVMYNMASKVTELYTTMY